MNFYDNNPGIKNEFAQAGAQHDGGGAAPASAPASSPASGSNDFGQMNLAANTGYAPGSTSQVDPSTDPMFKAAQAGIPASTMQEMSNPYSQSGTGGDVAIPEGMHMQSNPFSQSGTAGMMPDMPGGYGSFDDGGAVGDNPSDLEAAMQAVNASFEYGKQKHGLGGQQQASAIPMAPGNPSNSGTPRPLPMPGPLPPTNNPFGKRNNPMPAGSGQSQATPDNDDETA